MIDLSLPFDQNARFMQRLSKSNRVLRGGVVGLAELQRILGKLAGFSVFIEEFLLPVLFRYFVCDVQTEGKLVSPGHFGENKGVPADIGRNIEIDRHAR